MSSEKLVLLFVDTGDEVVSEVWEWIKAGISIPETIELREGLTPDELKAIAPNFGFWIFITHGQKSGILIGGQLVRLKDIKGRCMVALACNVADLYGRRFVKRGGRAFAGWIKPIVFTDKYLEQLLSPIKLVFSEIMQGKSLIEVENKLHSLQCGKNLPKYIEHLFRNNVNSFVVFGDTSASINNIYKVADGIFACNYLEYMKYMGAELDEQDME